MSQGNARKKGGINWNLNLRAKSFLAILMTVASIFLVINLIVDPIITDTFSRDEKIDTEGKVQQAIAAFTSEITDLSGITTDWASWDDTYTFAADGNSAYIKSTLNTSSFVNNRLNLIAIFDTGGKTVWAEIFNGTQSAPENIPGTLLESLNRINMADERGKTGLIGSGSEWWIIAADPILTSEGSGPAHGTLFFGRLIDDTEIEHLRNVSRLLINLYPVTDSQIPPEVLQTAVVTRPLSENTIRGYSVLSDIDNKPSLVIAVDVPRTIYLGGQNTLHYFNLALITVTLMYSIVVLLFMEILVISRISNLRRAVSRIEWNGDEQRITVKGNDDVSVLGQTINTTLDKLDESRKTLELREKRFRLLAENAQDLIYRIRLDPEPRFEYISPSAVNLTGYEPEEFYHDPELGFKVIPPDDQVLLETSIISPDAYLKPIQIRLVKKDDSIIWTEQKNTPFYTAGKLVAVEGIARDITERKQTEAALRESEEKYRTLVDNLPVGVSITTIDGRRLERNKATAEMHGYDSSDEFSKITTQELYDDPRDRVRMLEQLEKGTVRNFEVRHKRKDGTPFWMSMSAIPMLGKNGEKLVITISQDIEERKQAEETLRQSEERYRLLAENVNDVIWTTDLNLKFTYISPSIRHLRGLEPDEALKESIEETMTPESFRKILDFETRGREALSRGETDFTAKAEIQQKHRNGSLVWVEVIVQFLLDRDKQVIGTVGVSRDISDRKKTEEALKASEEKFRHLVENAPVGIIVSRTDGLPIVRNRATMEMHGYSSKEEFDRIPATTLYVDPDDRKRILAKVNEGAVSQFETRHRRKDGSVFWISITAIPQVNERGEKEIVFITQDIDERKKAEEALIASEEKFRNLVENAPIGIAILEADGQFALRNKYLQEMYGFNSPEEMEKVPVSEHYYDTEDRKRYLELAKEGPVRDFEVLLKRRDGSLIWGLMNSIPNNGSEGRQLITVIQDITARKLAEKQLEMESRLLDAATDSIILREMNNGVPGKPVYANKAAYTSRGYTHDEFMSLPLVNIVSQPSLIDSHMAETMMKGENTLEIIQKKKDGSPIPVEIHTRLITLDGKTYLLSVVRDITRRKKAEEEREWLFQNEIALRKELENEIQKRAEFTRALVHELKTPLTPIMASSDLLVEELHEEPFLSIAKNINRGAVNLNNRIDELLDLVRGEIGMLHLNLKPVDTTKLMHDVFDYTAPSAMKNGEAISLEIPDFLPEITADEDRLRQVLLNLIGNAVKYTDAGGKIWLSAGVEGDNLVFRVKDTGHGIDEDEKERLFDLPYHRFDADREHLSGLGLGLSLARQLIELHKGKIWMESKKGVGSTFSFSIPIRKETEIQNKSSED